MAKKSTAKVTVTREDLDTYVSKNEERKAAQRKADDLETQLAPLKKQMIEFVRENGGPTRAIRKLGHLLSVKLVKAQPQWKAEFLKLAGDKKTQEVIEQCPPREQLEVEKIV